MFHLVPKSLPPSHAKFRGENAKFATLTICQCTKKPIWDTSHGLKLKNGADNYFATEEGTKLKMSSSDRRRRGVVKILSFRRVGGRALRRTRPRSNGHDSSAEARVGNDIATVCSGFESVHPNA